jgi:enterobacterial common antigen flippase
MNKSKENFSRILTSSSLIGGAQLINMFTGMLRVKCVALLIGPVGVGLVATYQTLTELFAIIAGLGLKDSAVRDISQADAKGDKENISRIILSLRRMCFVGGVLGTLVVLTFSTSLSKLTFGDSDYSGDIALISLSIMFISLKNGQIALLQGMRRIKDLAKLTIISAINGSIISVAFYWFYGVQGIVPAIVLFSLIELYFSWRISRKILIDPLKMSWLDSFKFAGGMLNMGLVLMWNALLITLVAYFTRTIIAHEIDLISVGLFSAAFALSGMLVNFILGAMSADYYPSLTAINSNHKKMQNLVNQQTEIGILISIPGLLAMLALSPWLVELFYTSEFTKAAELLRWFSLGCIGRILSWPLGFILLAKGCSKLFLFTETSINLIHLVLISLFLNWFGIEGVAKAFSLLYVIYTIMMLIITYKVIGMKWSVDVWKLITKLTPYIALTFIAGIYLPKIIATIIGLTLTVIVSLYCSRELMIRVGSDHKITRLLKKIPLIRI